MGEPGNNGERWCCRSRDGALAHSPLVLPNREGAEHGDYCDDPGEGLEYQGSLVEPEEREGLLGDHEGTDRVRHDGYGLIFCKHLKPAGHG